MGEGWGTFTAIFEMLGIRHRGRKSEKRTVLLTGVKDSSGAVVCEKIWIWIDSPDAFRGLARGTTIQFDSYGFRDGADYQMSRPRNVRRAEKK